MHHHSNVVENQGEQGAGLVEYALLLALIAVVCFSVVTLFGQQNEGGFKKSRDCISGAIDSNDTSTCPS